MNVIGRKLKVLSSADPTKTGVIGTAVLETANTLVIDSGSKKVRIEKQGSAFMIRDSGVVLTGSDLAGRLEDRWGRGP